MKKYLILVSAALTLAAIVSCSDNDSWEDYIPQVEKTLLLKYPDAQDIEWSTWRNYLIADFDDLGEDGAIVEREAWYDSAGKWYMTDSDIAYTSLPVAVQSSFEQGEYATWRVDDVDELTRPNMPTLYIIEVENAQGAFANMEVDLYYLADGTFVKSTTGGEGYVPLLPSQRIMDYINKNYPSAEVLDIDRQQGVVLIDILDSDKVRTLYFSLYSEWLMTRTSITAEELPEAIQQAIAQSKYADWEIDEAAYIERPRNNYYEVELDGGATDVTINFAPSGEIISTPL